MFPWFLATAIRWIVRPLGLQVVVRARQGALGFDRLYIQRPGTMRGVYLDGER